LAEHDVRRLEIAMDHAAAVGIGNGIANDDEARQQGTKLEFRRTRPALVGSVVEIDGVLESLALDEAHGVEGPAVGVLAQAVYRHDARMLQTAGDLRFADKAAA